MLRIDGWIEMADYRPKKYKCRISPISGGSIICKFKENIADLICDGLRNLVSVIGKGKVTEEGIIDFEIEDIIMLEGEPEELFKKGDLSLGQAAKLKGISKSEFIEYLGQKEICIFDYSMDGEIAYDK